MSSSSSSAATSASSGVTNVFTDYAQFITEEQQIKEVKRRHLEPIRNKNVNRYPFLNLSRISAFACATASRVVAS
jgi:hypothetical protein